MESIYELYPKMSPLSKKLAPSILEHSKLKRQSSLQRIKRDKEISLLSQYSQLCKNSSKQYLSKRKSQQRTKHSLSTLNHYEYGKSMTQNKSITNKVYSFNTINPLSIVGSPPNEKQARVENVISNRGIYDEQLKNAKMVQNKNSRKVLVMSSKKVNQEFIKKSTLKDNEINPETFATQSPSTTKYSNKSMAFKTINLLYKAIIDSSFKQKNKQQFEIQANKLPIIDRFMATKRLNKFREDMMAQKIQKSATLEPLQARATRVSLYHTITRMSPPKEKSVEKPAPSVEIKPIREDLDIVPWSIEEQQQLA